MIFEVVNFDEKPKELKEEIFEYVEWTSHLPGGGLAPVTVEELKSSDDVLIAMYDGLVAGFIRAKPEIVHPETGYTYQQIGSLIVLPEFQGHDVGSLLVKEMTLDVIDVNAIPFAFVNECSRKAFSCYDTALPGELPPSVMSARGNEAVIYPMSRFPQMLRVL